MHRMHQYILCFCLFLFAQSLWGESVQRVIVVEYVPDLKTNGYQASKTPLPQVEIQVQGASSTVTNRNGECNLRFNTLNVGDRIIVRRVSRPGYVVFHPQMLIDMVIHRDNEPIVITMISQENLVNLTRMTEKMVNTQIEKQKKQEIQALNPAAADYARKREAIQRKYDAKLDDIEQYIERLVHIDFTNLSKHESEIAEAYRTGDMDMLLEQFDRSNLIEKYKTLSKSLHNVENAHSHVNKARAEQQKNLKEITQYLQYQITLLKMEGSEESLTKAMKLLERMLDIEPFGHFQMKECMEMSMQLKQYNFVDSLIRHHLMDPEMNDFYRCRYLTDLSMLLFDQQRYDEIYEILTEVLLIRAELYNGSINESSLSIFHMLAVHQMMGRIFKLSGERELAVSHFREAFDYYMSLRELDSSIKLYADVSYRRLQGALIDLCELGELQLADSIFQIVYPRVEELFSRGSVRDRYIYVAYRLLKVYMMHFQGKHLEALGEQMDVVPELSNLYMINRPMCEELYQNVLFDITIGQYRQGNWDQVVYYADRWFAVLRTMRVHGISLDTMDPQESLNRAHKFAQVLSFYAFSLYKTGRNNRTEAVYCEAIDLMEKKAELAKLDPVLLSVCYANVSEIRYDRGEYESARKFATRALDLNPASPTANDILQKLKDK